MNIFKNGFNAGESLATVWKQGFEITVQYTIKALLVIVFWIIGRWIINKFTSIIHSRMKKHGTDKTLTNYTRSILNISLQIILIIGIMGFLGIQTTTLTALIAASGLAIGMAWSGLLSNFAAGIFLIFLKPFRVSDIIALGDSVVGEVKEIGIFSTTINTADNVRTIIGNNQIFTGIIKNYSVNKYRRIDIKIQVTPETDIDRLAEELREHIFQIPGVIKEMGMDIGILEFSLSGPVIIVRPYSTPEDYWNTYLATTKVIKDTVSDRLQISVLQTSGGSADRQMQLDAASIGSK